MAAQNLSASNAARLMQCPGSADLKRSIPGWAPPVEDPNKWKARGEGTKIHEILEDFGGYVPDPLSDIIDLLEKLAGLHWRKRHPIQESATEMAAFILKHSKTFSTVDSGLMPILDRLMETRELAPKMIRFIAEALSAVCLIKGDLTYSSTDSGCFQELTMDTFWLAKPGKTTVDFGWFSEGTLGVADYKTGAVDVQARDNDQLMFYAVSLWEHLFRMGRIHNQQIKTIELRIMQPDNFSEHTVTFEELMEWKDRVLSKEQLILAGSTQLKPGDHCTFCPANPHARGEKGFPLCPAKMELLYPAAIDVDDVLNIT